MSPAAVGTPTWSDTDINHEKAWEVLRHQLIDEPHEVAAPFPGKPERPEAVVDLPVDPTLVAIHQVVPVPRDRWCLDIVFGDRLCHLSPGLFDPYAARSPSTIFFRSFSTSSRKYIRYELIG